MHGSVSLLLVLSTSAAGRGSTTDSRDETKLYVLCIVLSLVVQSWPFDEAREGSSRAACSSSRSRKSNGL